MATGLDDLIVGGQLRVGAGLVPAIKEGDTRINGSAHLEGPVVIGAPNSEDGGFGDNVATLMIARTTNDDADCTPADRSLWVKGNTRLQGDAGTSYTLNVTGDVTIIGNTEQTGDTNQVGNITASGTIKAATLIGAHTSGSISGGVSGKSSGAKAFDIPHPSRAGYRLRHICLEGPESAVYFRGRLKNRKVIKLPTYWEKLVDPTTITVNLTPYGSHQDIIVKRLDSTEIHLQSNGGLPIDCFYHVYGTRQDIERLSVEYEGATSDDYPGDNSIYSINK
tara:strand:- start:350 stop:1186 length:837 start_codon:yes stop_codon:yes gene_type:complete